MSWFVPFKRRSREEIETLLEQHAENFPDKGTQEDALLVALKTYITTLRSNTEISTRLRNDIYPITYLEWNLTTSAFLKEKLEREHIGLQPFEAFYQEVWPLILEIYMLLPRWRTNRLAVNLRYSNQHIALKRKGK